LQLCSRLSILGAELSHVERIISPPISSDAGATDTRCNTEAFMSVRKLDMIEWHPFCDHISKSVIGKRAEVQVASTKIGSQIEAEWLPLLGMVYDPKNDIIAITLESLDHMIRHPKEFYVDLGPVGLMNFEIIDADGVRHIVILRDPLMLPPPANARQGG
jgi:hypothetical protein